MCGEEIYPFHLRARQKKEMNKRGVALILCYTVVVVLTVLGAAFLARSISENVLAERFVNSSRAFWIAEAGLAQAYQTWLANPNYAGGTANFAGGTYTVVKTAGLPEVSVTGTFPPQGTYASTNRTVNAFFINIPFAFNNMLSTGGNLTLNYPGLGGGAIINVNGNTVYFGNYTKDPRITVNFNPAARQTTDQNEVSIRIPDYNHNGTADEFSDFVAFGQTVVQGYSADQVVYLTPSAGQTLVIYPNHSAYLNKKVVFVQGSAAGEGDVNIIFDATWASSQDLTVISTGTVNYFEPLNFPGSRLNTIAWEGYNEGSVLLSNREGVIYSHSNATFMDRFEIGFTTGNIIANGNLTFNEKWSWETFNYSNRATNGDLPPGFQCLTGGGTARVLDWQEAQ